MCSSFQGFLKSRETGLIQKSAEWVRARQETVGASEISVLTGSSPFETKETLISKKIWPADMRKNVACTWGFLFKPIVRRYFEQKHSVKVFGHTMSLNLAKDHPLYGKVTCSPDGYFSYKDESIVLLECKCPYKRKIAVNQIPRQYADQIQTGLVLSGESVEKGLFVDACFRMCSLKQLGLGLEHNPLLNGGVVHRTKKPSALACGVCLLHSKEKLFKTQDKILDLGATKSTAMFEEIMRRISSKKIIANTHSLYIKFGGVDFEDESAFLKRMSKEKFEKEWPENSYKPVAFFAWKLLDITNIMTTKQPNVLESIQEAVNTFYENLSEQNRQSELPTIKNTGDDSALMKAVFAAPIEQNTPLCISMKMERLSAAPIEKRASPCISMKMEPLPFGQSHWDYLPVEIQEHILDLVAKRLHSDRMKLVCRSIQEHAHWRYDYFF